MEKQDRVLAGLRRQIDALDREIVDRLQRRATLAIRVGEEKGESKPIYVPERECQVLTQVAAAADGGPLDSRAITTIYREVLSACRALEKVTAVAYLGPENTFTHQAAFQSFGSSAILQAAASVDHVFQLVESDVADYGVVPLENSTEGGCRLRITSFPVRLASQSAWCIRIRKPSRSAVAGWLKSCPRPIRWRS